MTSLDEKSIEQNNTVWSVARDAGRTRYFTGTPCKHGHVAERMVSNRRCVDCLRHIRKITAEETLPRRRIVKKAWDDRNPDKGIEYYWKNRDHQLKKNKEWRRKNPEKMADCLLNWRVNNKQRCKDYQKKWIANNKERVKAVVRNRKARVRGNGGSHTAEQIIDLKISQKYECANPYCRKSIREEYHADHIVPVISGGSNNIDNIQLLCPFCNHSKWAHPLENWLERMKRRNSNVG